MKTALVFGGTGLVGTALLQQLSSLKRYDKVISFVRKTSDFVFPGIDEVVIDFDNPDSYKARVVGTDVYICLGTTLARAGSRAAFYKVDHDYITEAARIASENGVNTLCLISAMGASSDSWIYYSNVKGRTEEEVAALPFEAVHIVRPALLLGDRKEFRAGERLAVILSERFPWLYSGPFAKYKAIEDKTVAIAMINLAFSNKKGVHYYESSMLHQLGANIL